MTVESDELWISRQHLLFSNSISMSLKGNVLSNGLTYATTLPMIVFLGIKVDLVVFKAAKTIPVHPGKILTLFLATIRMQNLLYIKFVTHDSISRDIGRFACFQSC